MNLKSSFVNFLNKKYPDLAVEQLNQLIADQLLSPFQVPITAATLDAIKSDILKYEQLKDATHSVLIPEYQKWGLRQPENSAVCTSYDFHINSSGQPELIEINTNAAFLALGIELYEFLNLPMGTDFSQNNLVKMFQTEMKLSRSQSSKIYILDEKPQEQRLFIEFLVYQQIFKKHGLSSEIIDLPDIEKLPNNSFIYNRYTDFYLDDFFLFYSKQYWDFLNIY